MMPVDARDFGPNEPLVLLHFAFRAVVEQPDRRLARLGLGRVHHRVLFCIARMPGLTVGELLSSLAVTKQALNGPLRALVRAKLVRSEPDQGNRRQRLLTLTARGRALEVRLSGHQRKLFADAFRSAGPAAVRGWLEVTRALAAPSSSRARRP